VERARTDPGAAKSAKMRTWRNMVEISAGSFHHNNVPTWAVVQPRTADLRTIIDVVDGLAEAVTGNLQHFHLQALRVANDLDL
jgi:hypothetical protein